MTFLSRDYQSWRECSKIHVFFLNQIPCAPNRRCEAQTIRRSGSGSATDRSFFQTEQWRGLRTLGKTSGTCRTRRTALAMARVVLARVEKLQRLSNTLRYRFASLSGVQPQTFGGIEIGSITVECNRSQSSDSAFPSFSKSRARRIGGAERKTFGGASAAIQDFSFSNTGMHSSGAGATIHSPRLSMTPPSVRFHLPVGR